MKTLNVCICDDDAHSIMAYSAAVKGSFQSFGVAAEVDAYNSAASLRARLEKLTYDIIFLDIDMPKEDGITFARSLRKQNDAVPIVFVTAREDRMFDTFSVQPFGFVRKSRFLDDLNETVKQFLQSNPELTAEVIVFTMKKGGGTFQTDARQIVYIESSLHTQALHLRGTEATPEIRSSMADLEKSLSEKGFIRIHKGYIVNYRYIKRIEKNDVYLTTGEILPLSRAKRNEVKAFWLEYGCRNGFTYVDKK